MSAVWTEEDITRLRNMAEAQVSRVKMPRRLARSQKAVRAQLVRLGLLR
jgi:hypothetical protein